VAVDTRLRPPKARPRGGRHQLGVDCRVAVQRAAEEEVRDRADEDADPLADATFSPSLSA
jgi:hypothetical protein